jgi:spermidine synthase
MQLPKTVHTFKSEYGDYKIVDTRYNGRPARVLYGAQSSPQSGSALDDSGELLFDYNQRFLEIALSIPPSRVLVIGGGAFMLPKALYERFPTAQIDVVEIDSALIEAAYEYFNLPSDPRLAIYAEDGVRFAATRSKAYDLIIIDAFSGYTIPPHLVSNKALKVYARLLTKNGTVAMNLISEYTPRRRRLAHELIAQYREVFHTVALYPADVNYPHGEEQNFLLVGAQAPFHFEYLQSNAYTLYDE